MFPIRKPTISTISTIGPAPAHNGAWFPLDGRQSLAVQRRWGGAALHPDMTGRPDGPRTPRLREMGGWKVVWVMWVWVNTYRYITIVGWTSILTQLWLGVNKRYQGFDTLPCGWKVKNMCKWMIRFLEKYIWNCSWILHDVTTQHVDFEHQDLDFTCYLKQWKVGCSITYRTITSLEMPGCKWIDTWRILRYHPPFCVGKVWQKNGLITLELEKYG